MISEGRVRELISFFEKSDNFNFIIEKQINQPLFKKDLVEAKFQVDRWGTCITDWYFNSSRESEIKSLFPSEVSTSDYLREALLNIIKFTSSLEKEDNPSKDSEDLFSIWGANVHFVDTIPVDTFIGVSLSDDGCLALNDSNYLGNSVVIAKIQTLAS